MGRLQTLQAVAPQAHQMALEMLQVLVFQVVLLPMPMAMFMLLIHTIVQFEKLTPQEQLLQLPVTGVLVH